MIECDKFFTQDINICPIRGTTTLGFHPTLSGGMWWVLYTGSPFLCPLRGTTTLGFHPTLYDRNVMCFFLHRTQLMSYLRDSTFNYVIKKKKVGILFGWFWDVAKRQIIIYMSFADNSKLKKKLSYSSQILQARWCVVTTLFDRRVNYNCWRLHRIFQLCWNTLTTSCKLVACLVDIKFILIFQNVTYMH